MFSATLLGHHAWLFEASDSRVLVDPLLFDRFGFTDSIELRVFPPRTFDFGRCPPLDAILLTHEHEGHFDLASLALFSRDIPVYMSSRSSLAMRRILGEMGFQVRLVRAGDALEVGELVFHLMTGDQTDASIEEWDVLAYLVRDKAGHGSFFTNVDVLATPAMWRAAREVVPKPGLWALTSNASAWNFLLNWAPVTDGLTARLARQVVDHHADLSADWASPVGLMIVGGGFSFGGDQAWLNRHVFPVDNMKAADALALTLPRQRVLSPAPGETLVMQNGELEVGRRADGFVAPVPRDRWPEHVASGELLWLESYTPCCGRTDFPDEDLDALARELHAFAAHLYGRHTFRALHSITDASLGGRKPTFALALKADAQGGAYVFEYVPQACAFEAVSSEDPASEYVAVFECWATDLLAHFRADIAVNGLGFGRYRAWNAAPTAFRFDLNHALFEYMHPMRYPERFLDLYRRVVRSLPKPERLLGGRRT